MNQTIISPPPPAKADADSPQSQPQAQQFLNRDLSWLEFNRRVLHEALDDRTPLLERLRFLGIFTTNLDEFFMKRVATLRRQALVSTATAAASSNSDGRTPAQILAAVRKTIQPMLQAQAQCFEREIRPRLSAAGFHLLQWRDLTPAEREWARNYFQTTVFPVLTPLAVDPGSPFPFISNLSMSLGVVLHHPDRGDNLFARVKVPETFPKWIQVGAAAGQLRFLGLHDLIRENLSNLFPDMAIVDVMPFRLTRSAEVEWEVEEEDAEDLRELVQHELKQRRFAHVVRLEHGPDPNPWVIQFLMGELELTADDVYELPGELDYDDFRTIAELSAPGMRYDPWTPCVPPRLADEDTDVFAVIRNGDLLLHHPYDSFTASVERFINSAAADPRVLAIKLTLYRTSEVSPFVSALSRAAEAAKQVVCLIELKARFDEERNIQISNALERSGVHALYGVVGLKTHCKTALVVRQEPDGIRCYAHIGTGNYHAQTARLYTDVGLLTCDPDLTRDVVELFHYLTGRSLKRNYRRLLVAPANMREQVLALIAREVEHARAGRPAAIIAKMNALEDKRIIAALYDASREQVPIDLIVRGFCTIRPGVNGMSENIRVRSIVGRFLEHSRVFYYRNGAPDPVDGEFYIGSADWMNRNLSARVEAVAPIQGRPLRERLWHFLQTMLNDRRQAWEMDADGRYKQLRPSRPEEEAGTHQVLMDLTKCDSAVTPQELQMLT